MPPITTRVLKTSEAEWTASDTIAPERANSPAANLKAVSARLTAMLTPDTRMATRRPSSASLTAIPSFILRRRPSLPEGRRRAPQLMRRPRHG